LAVAVTFEAGMVRAVGEALGFCTVTPVQSRNACPAGGAFAAIVTTLPAAYVPLPVPFTTCSVYEVGEE